MAAGPFQGKHDFGQLFCRDRLALAQMADIPVLAKHAFQIATGEENGARPGSANQDTFFAKMGTKAGDLHRITRFADSLSALQAVSPASMGTKVAAGQPGAGFSASFF